MTELPQARIVAYLRDKKRQGYTIVGLEQAELSVPLERVVFPERVVLVLGNEAEGMPVRLIQELDLCVEIPQFGLIRSLNVHVSAALLIWEYCRQRINALPSSL